jgi:DNA-binding IclR family transcriptional regulator
MEIARLHGLYAASQSLDRIVPPVLRALAAATGESAAYHVRQDQGESWVRLCQFRVDSSHVVRDHVRVGDLLPNDRGAGARVLIAFGPEAERPRGAKERKLYDAIRAQGYCALVGDRTAELAGISAPVFHADGSLAAAVTLTMPTHRYDEGYIEPVRAAAKELSGRCEAGLTVLLLPLSGKAGMGSTRPSKPRALVAGPHPALPRKGREKCQAFRTRP